MPQPGSFKNTPIKTSQTRIIFQYYPLSKSPRFIFPESIKKNIYKGFYDAFDIYKSRLEGNKKTLLTIQENKILFKKKLPEAPAS